MKIYNISRLIKKDMLVYKNKESKRPTLCPVATHKENHMHESELHMNLHTGTHIDAPLHMIDGAETIDEMDLSLYMGAAKVLDLTKCEDQIYVKDVEKYEINEGDIILLKTKNSFHMGDDYAPNFGFISVELAEYLRKKGIKTVGLDAPSIERGQEGHPTHKIILGAGIGVIEDLRLAEVPEGTYTLQSLPLFISQAEASPVRAILIEE